MIGFRIIISILIVTSLQSQQDKILNGDLDGTGIYLNNISLDWSDSKKNIHLVTKLNTLEFGFKKLDLRHTQFKDEKKTNIAFQGPDLSFNGLDIQINSFSPNWIEMVKSYYQQERQKPAIKGIDILLSAIDSFSREQGRIPKSYNELVLKNYFQIDQYPFDEKKWNFELLMPDKIIATLLSNHYTRKSDQKIIYDLNLGEYYGDYNTEGKLDSIPWNISFSIQDISQTFGTEVKFNYSPKQTYFEFFQKRGKFNITGINLEAIPKSNIHDLAQFKLSNIGFETRNLAFSGTLKDTIPRFHQGQGRFLMRNLEVNIPTSLTDDPEFDIILEKLGIWNGVFRIRLIDFELKVINEQMGEIKFRFQTPFINIFLDGDLSFYHSSGNTKLFFQQTLLRINPISLGIRSLIRDWEKSEGQNLPRKSGTIVLKINGPITKPRIEGLNFNYQ